jgi:hypothetical protein
LKPRSRPIAGDDRDARNRWTASAPITGEQESCDTDYSNSYLQTRAELSKPATRDAARRESAAARTYANNCFADARMTFIASGSPFMSANR